MVSYGLFGNQKVIISQCTSILCSLVVSQTSRETALLRAWSNVSEAVESNVRHLGCVEAALID